MSKLSEFEASIIKRLLSNGKTPQEILQIINNHRSNNSFINIGRILGIKNNKRFINIPMATQKDLSAFIKNKISSPTSTNAIKNILFTIDGITLRNKETQNIEYKIEYNKDILKKSYKTICGLANTRGGYIIFGIDDKNREILGLSETQFNNFTKIDNANMEFEKIFNQEIKFKFRTFIINNKKLGILYIYKSIHKPVIFQKKFGDYKEGEIYYRYNAKTQLIKSAELENIIKERITNRIQEIFTDTFKNNLKEITDEFCKKIAK